MLTHMWGCYQRYHCNFRATSQPLAMKKKAHLDMDRLMRQYKRKILWKHQWGILVTFSYNEHNTIILYVLRVQRSAKMFVRGCEKFVPALAYLFCPALPGSCLARFAYFLADLCTCTIFTMCMKSWQLRHIYRDRQKSIQILLSRTQPEPGRTGKQEQ